MTLKERLNADFKEAMKNKQTVRKETISFVRAAIKQYEVDNREEIDDAGIASILAKQVKMRKDALADFEQIEKLGYKLFTGAGANSFKEFRAGKIIIFLHLFSLLKA